MAKRVKSHDLGRRERQIMDAIYRLGEASVAEVRSKLPDAPSYSAVRTMVRLLESKGLLRHRQDGKRYVYSATQSRDKASQSALRHLLKTFFDNSASAAVAAILDDRDELSDDEIRRIESMIKAKRKKGKR